MEDEHSSLSMVTLTKKAHKSLGGWRPLSPHFDTQMSANLNSTSPFEVVALLLLLLLLEEDEEIFLESSACVRGAKSTLRGSERYLAASIGSIFQIRTTTITIKKKN